MKQTRISLGFKFNLNEGRLEDSWLINASEIDCSEDELAICINKQLFGDLEKEK